MTTGEAAKVLASQQGDRTKVSASIWNVLIIPLRAFMQQNVLSGTVPELDHILFLQLHEAFTVNTTIINICPIG